ncbi:MAG: hypothetical protein PHR87_12520 [Sulfurospirillaceae bacterium]|nr:hypothetical protein [Sulfurospirillaceae bacterium]
MKLILTTLSIMLIFTGCSHKMTYVDFSSGEVLMGHYVEMSKDVEVKMPNGEVLKGKYSNVHNSSFAFGNSFTTGTATVGTTTAFGSANTFGNSISVGGAGKAYALLRSETSTLMMELLVDYSVWDGSGFGEARTNDGRRYRVQF